MNSDEGLQSGHVSFEAAADLWKTKRQIGDVNSTVYLHFRIPLQKPTGESVSMCAAIFIKEIIDLLCWSLWGCPLLAIGINAS